jgi:hypothetical protein
MRTRVFIATFAAVLGLSAAAHAATISSPAIFGSHGQNHAYCVVLNTSNSSVSVTLRILYESGAVKTQGTQTIAPGQFIVAVAAIEHGVAFACSATAGTVAGLSGALTITDEVPDGFGGSLRRAIRTSPLR